MDFDSLTKLMDEELALYIQLLELFRTKKKILIKNDITNLKIVDRKILETIDLIKTRAIKKSFALLIQEFPNHKQELVSRKRKFKTLSKELSHLNKTNLELIKHGIVLADTRLKSIINICNPKNSGYGKYGQSVSEPVTTIIQEV